MADVWVVRYLRLETGTEMVRVILGGSSERSGHSMLPLPLDAADKLANEIDAFAAQAAA